MLNKLWQYKNGAQTRLNYFSRVNEFHFAKVTFCVTEITTTCLLVIGPFMKKRCAPLIHRKNAEKC